MSELKKCENFFRRVSEKPNFWKKATNRPSSALFKDSKGVSVNKVSGRFLVDVISFEEGMHERYASAILGLRAIVSVSDENCNEKEILIKEDPLEDNRYHALVIKSESSLQLTDGQAKHLAKVCNIEKLYKIEA